MSKEEKMVDITKNMIFSIVFYLILGCVWVIIILATYQSLSCSPVILKNEDLGEMLKLKTDDPNHFHERLYADSQCYRYPAPYQLSANTVRIELVVAIRDLRKHSQSQTHYEAISKNRWGRKIKDFRLLIEVKDLEASRLLSSFDGKHEEVVFVGRFDTMTSYDTSTALSLNVRPVIFKAWSIYLQSRNIKTPASHSWTTSNEALLALVLGGLIFSMFLPSDLKYVLLYCCGLTFKTIPLIGLLHLLFVKCD